MEFEWDEAKNLSNIIKHGSHSRMPPRVFDDVLNALSQLPDEEIDFSDRPELGDEFFDDAIRGDFYRPIKKQTTLRLDADLIEWFKRHTGTRPPAVATRRGSMPRCALM